MALAVAYAVTPVARRTAIRLDIVDHPGGRKAHSVPVPYLGGVAIYLAFILILVLAVVPDGGDSGFSVATGQLIAIVGGASMMALIGLLDDRFDLSAGVKLLGQFTGACVLLAAQVEIHFNHHVFAPLEAPITVVWVIGITNAFNLMDNMDGLAVGTAGIAATFFFMHAILALPLQNFVASLAAALAGACFGFLFHNWSPAKIFMGDAGSLFLGFILSSLALKLSLSTASPDLVQLALRAGYTSGVTENLHAIALVAPVLVLGIPIFDTSLVTISRLRRGVKVSQGGRDHLSHRLVGAGLTQREAVMTLYLASCALGALSIVLTRVNLGEGLFVLGVVAVVAAYFFVRFERMYRSQIAALSAGIGPDC